jgi:WD40 repeat protein
MSYRPVDNVLVTAGYGDQILLWDTRTAQAQRKLKIPHKHITSVECLSLEGSTLIWNGAEDSVIRIWDLRNLSVPTLRRYSSKQLTRKSSFATIESPRNEVIGETQLIGHTQPVRTISTKGNTIVSGGDDCCVILWDTQRSEMVEQLKGHTVPVRTVQVIE